VDYDWGGGGGGHFRLSTTLHLQEDMHENIQKLINKTENFIKPKEISFWFEAHAVQLR
jgi:aminoglycoside N3'-acetyltransferase